MGRSLAEIQKQWNIDMEDSGWKDIPGLNKYELDMYGKCRSKATAKVLKPQTSRAGSFYMLTNDEGETKLYLRSNLVKLVFPKRTFVEDVIIPKPTRVAGKTPEPMKSFPGERWRLIYEFDAYEISDRGRIRRVSNKVGLNASTKKSVVLRKDGIGYRRGILTLMKQAWPDVPYEDGRASRWQEKN